MLGIKLLNISPLCNAYSSAISVLSGNVQWIFRLPIEVFNYEKTVLVHFDIFLTIRYNASFLGSFQEFQPFIEFFRHYSLRNLFILKYLSTRLNISTIFFLNLLIQLTICETISGLLFFPLKKKNVIETYIFRV